MERHQVAEIFLADRSTNRFNTYLWSLFLHTLTEFALHKCVFEHYTTCMSDLVSKLLGTYMIVSHTCRDAACARSRKRSKREPEMQARCVRAGTHLTEATRPLRPPPPPSGEVCSHLTRSPSPPPSATLTGVKRRAVR